MAVMDTKMMDNVLRRLVRPDDSAFSAEVSKTLLEFDFTPAEQERIIELGRKSNSGTLSEAERSEYEWWVIVGSFVSLLQSKARQSLKRHSTAA